MVVPPPPDPTLEPESPSILGRIGQQAANLPSNIINDMLRLMYNTGISDTKEQVDQPFSIPEARTLGEGAVDIGANLVESLPMFMTGEGAGAGIGRAMEAGPILSRMLKVGAGFGASEADESPARAASGAMLGAGMGAAETLPGPARFVAAGAVGAATAAEALYSGGSPTQAAVSGAANTLMPLLLGGRGRTARRVDEASSGALPAPLELPTPPEGSLVALPQQPSTMLTARPNLELKAPQQMPEGSIMELPKIETKPSFQLDEGQQDLNFARSETPTINGPALSQGERGGMLPFPPPEGSLVRDPVMTMLESRRGMGVQPPEGSLIRDPIMTEREAMAGTAYQRPVVEFPQPVATLQPEVATDHFQDLANQQRGLPEDAMMDATLHMGGGVVNPVLEHTGDLIHRMTQTSTRESGGYTYVKEKVDRVLRALKNGYGFEKEFEENITNNAKYRSVSKSQFAQELYSKMQRYADEHSKLPTFNEVQGLAKEAAVAVGERRFDDAQVALEKLSNHLEKGEDHWTAKAHEGLQKGGFPPPPAQSESNRLLLSSVLSHENEAMVKSAAEKLGIEYHGVWPETDILSFKIPENAGHEAAGANFDIKAGATYKDLKNKLAAKIEEFKTGEAKAQELGVGKYKNAKSKVGPEEAALDDLVATLQPKKAAVTPPSPVETPTLPQGLKIGDKALFTVEGEHTVGTIQPSVEPNTVRLIEKDGTPHDVPTYRVKQLGVRVVDKESSVSQVGGLEEIAKVAEQGVTPDVVKLKNGGGMKKSNFGEHGSAAPELLTALARYGAAPAAGAVVGAVVDNDHPIAGAVAGALMVGTALHFGPKVIRALLEAHPEVKAAAGITETTTAAFKAAANEGRNLGEGLIGADAKANRAVKEHIFSSSTDRMARWIEQNFKTDAAAKRLTGKAAGEVEVLSKTMWEAIRALSKEPKSPDMSEAITRYFEGGSSADLERAIGNKVVSDLAITASTSRTALQNIAIQGLGDGKLSHAIKESIGKYMTTAYRVFHDDKYVPSDTSIRATAERMTKDLGTDVEINYADLQDYLHEIKANKGMWRGSGNKSGAAIDVLLSKPEGLSQEFREMLGEYTDPVHRMAATALKLVNGARGAAFFNELANGVDNATGLKYALSSEELIAEKSRLHTISTNGSAEARQKAVATLQQLSQYIRVPIETSKGRLSGRWVPRVMRDQLATYDSVTAGFKTPLGQTMANVTNLIKYGHTVLSPLQFTRQVFSMPMLGILAKTDPTHWVRAYNVLRDTSAEGLAYREKLIKLGIWGGDTVGGMLHKDMSAMLTGNLDAQLHNSVLRQGLHKWEEIYRAPDLMTRIAAYEKAIVTAKEKMGLAGDAAENYAIDYTNRYTVNYAAAPPGIQKLRQFPFVNQYLTFSFEVARITKNLTEDVIKRRDPAAAGILVSLASAPLILQKLSESQLSEKDRKDWEVAKSLAPEYSRMNFKFVHGRKPNGDFTYTDFTPLIIHDKWLKGARAVLNGDMGAFNAENPVLGWENTPLLNVASNMITGVDRHSHERLDSFGARLDSIRRDIAPTLLGGTDVDKFVAALTPNEDGTLGLTNNRSGATTSVWSILSSYITATRTYNVRPQALIKQTMNEAHAQVLNEQMLMRKVLNTNADSATKAAAYERFQSNVKEIVATLQLKINPPDTLAALSNSRS